MTDDETRAVVVHGPDMRPLTVVALSEWQFQRLADVGRLELVVPEPAILGPWPKEVAEARQTSATRHVWLYAKISMLLDEWSRNTGYRHMVVTTDDPETVAMMAPALLPGQAGHFVRLP